MSSVQSKNFPLPCEIETRERDCSQGLGQRVRRKRDDLSRYFFQEIESDSILIDKSVEFLRREGEDNKGGLEEKKDECGEWIAVERERE